MRGENYACGLSFWHPKWLQKYATSKWFLVVYGLLGTIQATSYLYFVVTLTTIERRFHVPSQTTGIILSGNEISQILLSLILSYMGGQRNRPLWIAWGMVFCGVSCFIIALPHLIYGAGDEAYYLTKEYFDFIGAKNNVSLINSTSSTSSLTGNQPLCKANQEKENCDDLVSVVPLVLIFLSQFILGIGNTLYYSLGQTYLDDNTKKRNTPIMLAYAMCLRMIGPIFGFFLGFVALNIYIDPTKTPVITSDDPRWLGAWWFGWMIIGTTLLLFSGLIALFPKKLPKNNAMLYDAYQPKALLSHDTQFNDDGQVKTDLEDLPKLKDFPKALRRLLTNKLLIFNNIAAIFYILGAAGFMTFMARYMEVQFHRSAQNATILVGPLTLVGMLLGILLSGIVISKRRPRAGKVLFWNVIIGFIYMSGQISYTLFHCGDTSSMMQDGIFNLTSSCNRNCHCDKVAYSPVCHETTGQTFFSPCHAGCFTWDKSENTYSNCTCFAADVEDIFSYPDQSTGVSFTTPSLPLSTAFLASSANSLFRPTTVDSKPLRSFSDIINPGVCMEGCDFAFYCFTVISLLINAFGSSGRIGNILVNYRAVSTKDKSFAQGLTLMMISLFAAIPGPILFGRVIDSTCQVWNYQCGKRGDCQLYDQTKFRYYFNILALLLTFIGALFDFLVWLYGRKLDLYGEVHESKVKELQKTRNTSNQFHSQDQSITY